MKALLKKLLPGFVYNWYHLALSTVGAFLYRFPSRHLIVIGITGTNGKSTTTHFSTAILKKAGRRVASISTVRFQIDDKEWKNDLKMTMPGKFKIQKFLRKAVDAGCSHVVLEVTSEGIKQHRHRFIAFDVAVLTNVRPEHIEAHGSFEKYVKAKTHLFLATPGTHIINEAEETALQFLDIPSSVKITFGGPSANVAATDITSSDTESSFMVRGVKFTLPMAGAFNISNALAAISIGISQDIELSVMADALSGAGGVPGRMEIVQHAPFRVIVDYAHTPDALEAVFGSVKGQGKLICVFGSTGGGRDTWKRPEMGKIAAQHCDQIFLTDEDPYDEDPQKIISEIRAGIPNTEYLIQNTFEVLDRKEAIKKALKTAQAGDVVAITGKGREPWMCVAGGKKIPWDDAQIAKDAL